MCVHCSIPPSFIKSNIRVPFWKISPLVKKMGSLHASPKENKVSSKGTPAFSYLPLQQEIKFKPLNGNEMC